MKLDKKDRKILYELDKDARQPLTKIAKKVVLSRESILYRMQKYLNEGVIKSFLTVVDISKMGFTHYKIYLKMHNLTEKKESDFIGFLVKNPFVSWVSNCDGTYSLVFAVKTKTILDLQNFLRNLTKNYGSIIKESEIITVTEGHHFYRGYLVQEKEKTEREIKWGGIPEENKLDKKDIEILDMICKDSRKNAVDIANKLKISADTVLNRIEKLEKSKVITHYMIWPDVTKLAGFYYKVLFNLQNLSSEKEKKLKDFCASNPNIIYIVHQIGKWQFEIDVEFSNQEEFRKIMKEILNEFSDIITDYTILNIYKENKFRFFEKEMLN